MCARATDDYFARPCCLLRAPPFLVFPVGGGARKEAPLILIGINREIEPRGTLR